MQSPITLRNRSLNNNLHPSSTKNPNPFQQSSVTCTSHQEIQTKNALPNRNRIRIRQQKTLPRRSERIQQKASTSAVTLSDEPTDYIIPNYTYTVTSKEKTTNTCVITGKIYGKLARILVDTGSTITLISEKFSNHAEINTDVAQQRSAVKKGLSVLFF